MNAFLIFFSQLIYWVYFSMIHFVLYETSHKVIAESQIKRTSRLFYRSTSPNPTYIINATRSGKCSSQQSRTSKDQWGGALSSWNMMFWMSCNTVEWKPFQHVLCYICSSCDTFPVKKKDPTISLIMIPYQTFNFGESRLLQLPYLMKIRSAP